MELLTMSVGGKFSERHGYQPPDAEITTRHSAPYDLRGVIVDLAYESGLSPKRRRSIVCRGLPTRENPNNLFHLFFSTSRDILSLLFDSGEDFLNDIINPS